MTTSLFPPPDRFPIIPVEVAVSERLRREPVLELEPPPLNTGLLYSPAGRSTMARIYSQCIRIATDYRLPILVAAPNWRANPQRIKQRTPGDVGTVYNDKPDNNGSTGK